MLFFDDVVVVELEHIACCHKRRLLAVEHHLLLHLIIRWILLAILLGGIGVGVYYLWRWYEKHRKPEEEPLNPELLRPADEVALEKLDAIKEQKIWKDGKVKEYQTELTDVVREYIGRRFEVHSTEKTSDETLRELKPILLKGEGLQVTGDGLQVTGDGLRVTGDGKELYSKLSKMLQLADLVKFAKWHTTPDENESALSTAYDFVNETKIVNDANDENDENGEKL